MKLYGDLPIETRVWRRSVSAVIVYLTLFSILMVWIMLTANY